PEEVHAIIAEIPADRMGTAEEAAALVLQLCTGNTYLTGQIINLDGGWI
ncbi:MAG TPA: 3-oxoacyl-ACP reductase, partial [Lachnospiraceae bacterium]|nr:3-oxoacyl-ACP reductase [Lachnospiraceae bacterium]